MTTDWIVQLVYSAIVAAFGFFLMWRTRVSVRSRTSRLVTGPSDEYRVSELNEKMRRLVELKAEVTRLEQELGAMSGSHPVTT